MGLAGFGGRGAAAADGQEEAPSLPYPPRLEPKVQVPQAQSPRRFLIGSWILYTDFIAFLYNSRLSESEGTLENISSTPAAQRRVGAQRVTWSHGQVGSELGDHSTPSWLWAAPRHSPGLACRECLLGTVVCHSAARAPGVEEPHAGLAGKVWAAACPAGRQARLL